MKQEDNQISFNSSSPRFRDNQTHQIRVLQGKDNFEGINFRLKQDPPIGPGSYETSNEIELQKRKRQQAQPGVFFGSAVPREQNNFLQHELKSSAFKGEDPFKYHSEKPFTKKTHNYHLSKKQLD